MSATLRASSTVVGGRHRRYCPFVEVVMPLASRVRFVAAPCKSKSNAVGDPNSHPCTFCTARNVLAPHSPNFNHSSARPSLFIAAAHLASSTYTVGPALMTSSVASSAYFLKFSLNRLPNLVTSSPKSAEPVQDFLGLRSSSGTFGQDLGTLRLNTS